jgi:hypothetical protein
MTIHGIWQIILEKYKTSVKSGIAKDSTFQPIPRRAIARSFIAEIPNIDFFSLELIGKARKF